MTRDDARTIWLALLTVAAIALGLALAATRGQVDAADGQFHMLLVHRTHAAIGQANKAAAASVSAQQLAAAIQQSRLAICSHENAVHFATLHALDRLFSAALRRPRSAGARAQIRRQQRSALLIFDAATPYRTCAQFISASP